jgi:hypothetical protein
MSVLLNKAQTHLQMIMLLPSIAADSVKSSKHFEHACKIDSIALDMSNKLDLSAVTALSSLQRTKKVQICGTE